MKFKLNLENLNEVDEVVREISNNLQEFEAKFAAAILILEGAIEEENLQELTSQKLRVLSNLRYLNTRYNEIDSIINKYLQGLQQINPSIVSSKEYDLDTSEIGDQISKIIKLFHRHCDLMKSWKMNDEIEEYETKISRFSNVDGSIKINEEYLNNIEKREFISARRIEIGKQIEEYRRRYESYLRTREKLIALEHKFKNWSGELERLHVKLEELKSFENEFDFDFWSDYGDVIKSGLLAVDIESEEVWLGINKDIGSIQDRILSE